MKKKNIYSVIVPTWFKIVSSIMYIAFAALMFLFDIVTAAVSEAAMLPGIDLLILGLAVTILELLADYAILGSVCGKGETRLQMLRSSFYGRKAIIKLASVDCLRRAFCLLGSSLLIAVGTVIAGHELPTYYFFFVGANTGLVLFEENISILIGRCIETFQTRMIVVSLISTLVFPINIFFFAVFTSTAPDEPGNITIYAVMTAIALIAGIISVVISGRITLKRMLAGYRDPGTIQ